MTVATPLRCTIDERFTLTGVFNSSIAAGGASVKPGVFLLELRQAKSDEVVTQKMISWPSGEGAPSMLEYNKQDGVLVVKNRTTIAKIPFRSHLLNSLAEQHEVGKHSGPRILSTFAPKGDKDKSSKVEIVVDIARAIRDLLADKTSDAKWKKLNNPKSFPKSGPPHLSSLLSIPEQKELLEIIKKKKEKDVNIESCLTLLLKNDLFSYRMVNEVIVLCLSSGLGNIIDKIVLDKQLPLPEVTFVHLLQRAVRSHDCSVDYLQRVLLMPFDGVKSAAAAASVLSTDDATKLIEVLTKMYEDDQCKNYHAKVLSLMSLLLDSHSARFINDAQCHAALLESAAVIADMASVVDTFAELEHTHAARLAMPEQDTVQPEFVIRTIHLTERVWSREAELAEKREARGRLKKDDDESVEGSAKSKRGKPAAPIPGRSQSRRKNGNNVEKDDDSSN